MKQSHIGKLGKFAFMAFSISCIIAIITCLIVNFAIDRAITWALYPLISVPFGWLVLSPLVVRKLGVLFSLCSFMIFVLPFLFLLEKITPVGGWFIGIGIPVTIIGVTLLWLTFLLFRFLKISLWFKTAITVFLAGVIASPLIDHYVNVFLNTTPTFFDRFLSIFPCIAVSVLLIVIGVRRRNIASRHPGPPVN